MGPPDMRWGGARAPSAPTWLRHCFYPWGCRWMLIIFSAWDSLRRVSIATIKICGTLGNLFRCCSLTNVGMEFKKIRKFGRKDSFNVHGTVKQRSHPQSVQQRVPPFPPILYPIPPVQNYAPGKGGGQNLPPANSAPMKARITKFLWMIGWLKISIMCNFYDPRSISSR